MTCPSISSLPLSSSFSRRSSRQKSPGSSFTSSKRRPSSPNFFRREARNNGQSFDFSKVLVAPNNRQSVSKRSVAVVKMLDDAQSLDGRSISGRLAAYTQLLDRIFSCCVPIARRCQILQLRLRDVDLSQIVE